VAVPAKPRENNVAVKGQLAAYPVFGHVSSDAADPSEKARRAAAFFDDLPADAPDDRAGTAVIYHVYLNNLHAGGALSKPNNN
jgi:hypothetical protein